MEQIADRLTDKIRTLTSEQMAEVEQFIDALEITSTDRALSRAMLHRSEGSFAAVWNNPEDDVYDAL